MLLKIACHQVYSFTYLFGFVLHLFWKTKILRMLKKNKRLMLKRMIAIKSNQDKNSTGLTVFLVFFLMLKSLTGFSQYQGIQVRDSICANITYVSSLPSNYPGENFTYQWLPNSLMNNNTLANPIFVFPYGYSELTYLRVRTGGTGIYFDTLRIVFLDNYPFDVDPNFYYCPNGINTIFLNGTQGLLVDPPVFLTPIENQPFYYNLNIESASVTQFSVQLINQNGCPTFPYTINITAAETLDVSIPPLPDEVCLTFPSFELQPGIPENGSYFINNLSNTLFNPVQQGIGLHQIEYRVFQNSCAYILMDSIAVVDLSNIVITEIPPVCPDDETINLSNIASPSGGIFTYNNIEITEFNPLLYASGPVNLTYTLSINETCSADAAFTIFIKPAPPKPKIVTFTGFNEFCFGDSLIVGVEPFTNILWNNGLTVNDFVIFETQTLTVQYTNSLGCSSFDTLTLVELDPLLLNLSSPTYANGFEISVHGANDGSIVASSGGGFPPYNFFESSLGSVTPPIINLPADTFIITVSDARGCRTTDTITLREPEKPIIDPEETNIFAIPNSFTPNGDGFNDFWVFKNLDYAPNNRLSIYNRWGQLIYVTNSYQNNWNGNVKDNTTETTYFYVFEDLTNSKTYKGYVQVMVK